MATGYGKRSGHIPRYVFLSFGGWFPDPVQDRDLDISYLPKWRQEQIKLQREGKYDYNNPPEAPEEILGAIDIPEGVSLKFLKRYGLRAILEEL